MQPIIYLKKNEDRRIMAGHVWVFSNEIDTHLSPLKNFKPGTEVIVANHMKRPLGAAYINPHSLITARLFSRNPDERLTQAFFVTQIRIALSLRQRLFNQPFYRLIFGESDRLPGLIVDRFDKTLVLQINTAGMEAQQAVLIDALRVCLPEVTTIVLRNDSTARTMENLETYVGVAWGASCEEVMIEENHAVFKVPILQGQKTGWFFDHRSNRQRLSTYVKGKTVLDVFSYLGAWGIQAAMMGADTVTCIDASAFACEYIQENARLNNVENKVHTMCEEAFFALKSLYQQQRKFDVIILDPPAFIKKQKDKKEGFIAYQRLNEIALKLLTAEGILLSCSCSMHMTFEELAQILRKASLRTPFELQILEQGHQAPDHPIHIAIPETDYLKMIGVRVVERQSKQQEIYTHRPSK